MKTVTRIAALATVLAAGSALGEPLEAQKVRVAVFEFENNSNWSYFREGLGRAASDEMVTQLVNSGQFTVVERAQIEAVLGEQNFGQSGRVNPSTAAEVGKILGVQIVFLGSITKFAVDTKKAGIGGIGGSYTEAEAVMDIRAVNTVTAEIMSVAEGKGKKKLIGVSVDDIRYNESQQEGLAQDALRPAVEDAVEEFVKKVADFSAIAPAMASANVVGERDGDVYIDRGQNFRVEVGQRFDVYRVIDEIRDAQGNVLDRVTDKVGVVEVSRVLSQSSICRIVEGEAAEGDVVQSST